MDNFIHIYTLKCANGNMVFSPYYNYVYLTGSFILVSADTTVIPEDSLILEVSCFSIRKKTAIGWCFRVIL